MRPRVDWETVISDLQATGLYQSELAEMLRSSYVTVLHMKHRGREPKFRTGEALIEIWAQKTGKAEASVPRVAR